MVLISLKDITNCDDYYIDDETLQVYSFKQNNKNGKLLKPFIDKNGYLRYHFFVNGKYKKRSLHSLPHYQLFWLNCCKQLLRKHVNYSSNSQYFLSNTQTHTIQHTKFGQKKLTRSLLEILCSFKN